MLNRALCIVVALIGCGDSLRLLDETEAVSADTGPPTIKSVKTDDGFHQIRQSADVQLVIRGTNLAGATSVAVGALPATIVSAADNQVIAEIFIFDGELGKLDVTVVTDLGTVTETEAIRVTPWVLAPDAVGGHGTFASPMSLCDSELEGAGSRDTVKLLAGTFQCDRGPELNTGVTVEGAGSDTVIVHTSTASEGAGFFVFIGNPSNVSMVRNLTFQQILTGFSVEVDSGTLNLDHVTDHGGGISLFNATANIDHYHYDSTGSEDTSAGLDLSLSTATVTDSSFRDCGPGVAVAVHEQASTFQGSFAMLDHVTVQGCDRGVVSGDQAHESPLTVLVINGSKFIGNRVAIDLVDANASITDTVIRDDDTTPGASETGIVLSNGSLGISGGRIADQSVAGISLFSAGFAPFDRDLSVRATGITIVGGAVGIDISDGSVATGLLLRNSTIRQQTVASVRLGGVIDPSYDLGRPGDPGMNALSVVSGFALVDHEPGFADNDVTRIIHATGTTLNGHSFDGQFVQDASLPPFYETTGPNGIQF
jgi:hypothetical protein